MAEKSITQPNLSGSKPVVVQLFPGQGEQHKDMYRGFEQSDAAAKVLGQGEKVLGVHPVVAAQSADLLTRTEWIQPLTVLGSVALHDAMEAAELPQADVVLGHSLGEYSALVASGAISIRQGIQLAHQRGLVSGEVLSREDNDGVMAAVIGMTPEQIDAACAEIDGLWPANYNSEDQIVLSGGRHALANFGSVVGKLYPNLRVKIRELDIRGAFHSPMVASAAEKLRPHIEKAKIVGARTPLLSPTTVEWVHSAADARRVLLDQFTSKVRFVQTIRRIGAICAEQGVEDIVFVQVGADKSDAKSGTSRDLLRGVLLNLVQRIWLQQQTGVASKPKLHTRRISMPSDIDDFAEYTDKLQKK